MRKLTESMKADAREALKQIDAILTLAEANFPRTRDIRIETAGTDPQGRMTLPYAVLAAIIEAGRRALSQAEGGAE